MDGRCLAGKESLRVHRWAHELSVGTGAPDSTHMGGLCADREWGSIRTLGSMGNAFTSEKTGEIGVRVGGRERGSTAGSGD